MKQTYLLGILIATPIFSGSLSFADSIVRTATATIIIEKRTTSKINGKYHSTDTIVCSKQISLPVVDKRIPGELQLSSDGGAVCVSDIKGKPVNIMTVPTLLIMNTTEYPGKLGQSVDVKIVSATSYLFFSESPTESSPILQEPMHQWIYTLDLSLSHVGISLTPNTIKALIKCNRNAEGKEFCADASETFEEYFRAHISIEDKSN